MAALTYHHVLLYALVIHNACCLKIGVETERSLDPKDSQYYWPSGHGLNGQYGASPYAGPSNLSSAFAWSWHHPEGRYHTLPYGTAIDNEKHIYVTTDTSIWKLSPKGKVIWSFTPTPRATIFSAGSLLDGKVHFTTLDGRMWAISMDTGEKLWMTKLCSEMNHDNGYVTAHEGVVIAATNSSSSNVRGANGLVQAVNATDGSTMWTYKPQMPLWNFMASFPSDGTVVYQDFEGRVYRHRLNNGELLYKVGGEVGSWTDGTQTLGSNGIVYTPIARMENIFSPGDLQAHRLSDGQLLWKAPVPMPPNNAPAIGRLPGKSSFSVVQPGGWQGIKGGPTGVWAFDADTGKQQWAFAGPSQQNDHQAGELEGMVERSFSGASIGYVTNPWSAATMDADGTVFVGHEDGSFFALRDANGDGTVTGPSEVSIYPTGAAFVGSSSPAHAPGMLVVANCDSIYVFETPTPTP